MQAHAQCPHAPCPGTLPESRPAHSQASPQAFHAETPLFFGPQVKPTGTVTIKLQATSYLGSSVAKAPLDLSWSTPQVSSVASATAPAAAAAAAAAAACPPLLHCSLWTVE